MGMRNRKHAEHTDRALIGRIGVLRGIGKHTLLLYTLQLPQKPARVVCNVDTAGESVLETRVYTRIIAKAATCRQWLRNMLWGVYYEIRPVR